MRARLAGQDIGFGKIAAPSWLSSRTGPRLSTSIRYNGTDSMSACVFTLFQSVYKYTASGGMCALRRVDFNCMHSAEGVVCLATAKRGNDSSPSLPRISYYFHMNFCPDFPDKYKSIEAFGLNIIICEENLTSRLHDCFSNSGVIIRFIWLRQSYMFTVNAEIILLATITFLACFGFSAPIQANDIYHFHW